MLFYSKPVEYALRALSYVIIYSKDRPCKTEEIANKEGIPRHFLSKIMQQMVRAKILKTIRGPGGGFMLRKHPKDTTLMEVVSVFDDTEAIFKECGLGWSKCVDSNPCPLHKEYKKTKENVRNYFNRTTLESFSGYRKAKKRF